MEYTQQEINIALKKIKEMDHYTMCYIWRKSPPGAQIYFRNDLPTSKAFIERLFTHFGGFTPEISKSLGWNDELSS